MIEHVLSFFKIPAVHYFCVGYTVAGLILQFIRSVR